MMQDLGPVAVFGATGPRGGSVAAALHSDGRAVRALVRAAASSKALAQSTVELAGSRALVPDPLTLGARLAREGAASIQAAPGKRPTLPGA